jgi:hypothetical protein
MSRICAVAIATAFLLLLLAGIPGAAGASQLRGVQLTPNYAFGVPGTGQPDADDSHEISSTCGLGAGVVREFVSWQALEKAGPGQVDSAYVAKLDSLMHQAAGCKLKVVMNLLGTPKWASSAPGDPAFSAYPPSDPGTYRWMVAWMMKRWPQLYGVEVWNEPDLANWWKGYPADYAALANAAVAAKADAGSRVKVIAGALARPAATYLGSLYAAGMRGQDAVSIHPYSAICTILGCQTYDPGPETNPFRSEIESIHAVMSVNGDAAPIWLTEFGFDTCPANPTCVSDSVQADWLSKSVSIAACYPYVGGLTVFSLRDTPVPSTWDTSNWQFHFGLVGTDFSPKPAYGAVRDTFSRLAQTKPSALQKSCPATLAA